MFALIYFAFLFAIGGASFALMYHNIKGISELNRRRSSIHPEAPDPGEEVMYVDLSREKLESLYNKGTE